ncbi:MAG: hypothetical protein H0V17_14625 [Deltaproteobacteria bacterium]|nr:hypothetical protein [Deltaproteobacteria bacterium]
MKLGLFVLLVACGGKQTTSPTSGSDDPPGPVKDTRTELEKRRDVACEAVGKKLTACALDDAKKDLAAGKVTQKEFDLNTTSDVLAKHTAEWMKVCGDYGSSRRVRVLEVCVKEETECGPLGDCLTHLNDKPGN